MRPRLKDQPAYDARSLELLDEYETGNMPMAALAELQGCAPSTIYRRLQRARELRKNGHKTLDAMHERIARLEAALAEMGVKV